MKGSKGKRSKHFIGMRENKRAKSNAECIDQREGKNILQNEKKMVE